MPFFTRKPGYNFDSINILQVLKINVEFGKACPSMGKLWIQF